MSINIGDIYHVEIAFDSGSNKRRPSFVVDSNEEFTTVIPFSTKKPHNEDDYIIVNFKVREMSPTYALVNQVQEVYTDQLGEPWTRGHEKVRLSGDSFSDVLEYFEENYE